MRLLLLGGGHAHAVALRDFARWPPQDAQVTVVTPHAGSLYSGMLPGLLAGHYAIDDCTIDFVRLARAAGAQLVLEAVAGLDAAARCVRLASGRALDYDHVSLNVGSAVAAPHGAIAVKPYAEFLKRIEPLLARPAPRIAVVGAGAAGVEIAMALRHRGASVALSTDKFLFRGKFAQRIVSALARTGVTFNAEPAQFDAKVWTTGAAPLPWLRESGLATDAQGFVLVDDKLRSISHAEVFAAGDCATLRDAPHPKSGVYAVRHGTLLAQNLRGGELRRYAPQRRALALISCGARYAIADWNGWSAEGAWAWRWKDRIDRRWIAVFRGQAGSS